MPSTPLDALHSSVARLAALVRPLDDSAIVQQAYPTEWTIADVLSHLGSGAVIVRRSVDDTLAGTTKPEDFKQGVWDEWNAKSPRAKVDDALAADAAMMARLDAVGPEDRDRFTSSLGPFELDWDAFVGLRLNEHLLHEWDVAVTLDPAAVLAADGTVLVVDALDLIGCFAAKPRGEPGTTTIATTDPERWFTVTVTADSVAFTSGDRAGPPDVSMPAESLVRLPHLLRAAAEGPRQVADMVNVSSVAGRFARNGNSVYSLTKHGVGALQRIAPPGIHQALRARLAGRAGRRRHISVMVRALADR